MQIAVPRFCSWPAEAVVATGPAIKADEVVGGTGDACSTVQVIVVDATVGVLAAVARPEMVTRDVIEYSQLPVNVTPPTVTWL